MCLAGLYTTISWAPHWPHCHHPSWFYWDQWWQLHADHSPTSKHGLQLSHPLPWWDSHLQTESYAMPKSHLCYAPVPLSFCKISPRLSFFFHRGNLPYLPLVLLLVCTGHLCDAHEPDSQMVAHILWPASLGGATAGLAHHPSSQAPPHSPRLPSRDLLLHHYR